MKHDELSAIPDETTPRAVSTPFCLLYKVRPLSCLMTKGGRLQVRGFEMRNQTRMHMAGPGTKTNVRPRNSLASLNRDCEPFPSDKFRCCLPLF